MAGDSNEAGRLAPFRGRRVVRMVGFILTLLVIGLVVGFLARWIVPGPDPISLARTVVIGLAGSVVGGLVGFWVFGADTTQSDDWVAGVLGALTGTVLLLMVDNYVSGRKDQITT
jgi:uncharacterized membrane protein YeaQ/YmgE (transglycosylase-associated protein family)